MNLVTLNPYVVTGYLTALITLGIGLFVYLKRPHDSIHKTFLIYSCTIVEWSFFTSLQAMQTESGWALFFGKVCHIGVLLIPSFFYYFTTKITGKENKPILKAGFISSIILTLLMLTTPYFIPSVRTDVGVNFLAEAGPLYIVIILFFFAYVALGLLHLWWEIKHSSGSRKKHLEYLFWASVIGFGLGGVNFFPTYGIIFFPYPYSAACGSIYFFVLGYAIVKHEMFHIDKVIKKGIIFGALFLTVYGTVYATVVLSGVFYAKRPLPFLWTILITVTMLIYEPLKRFLTKLTDKILFQEKRSYTWLIQNLTNKLANIPNSQVLAKEITAFLSEEMALDWSALYLLSPDEKEFTLTSSVNADIPTTLDLNDSMITLVQNKKHPILLSPFDVGNDLELEQKENMRKQKIEAVVPIFLEQRLYGILLLGEKKSDDAFTNEDMALLETLMDEVSMFFLKVKLLKEEVHSNLELGQRLKMASATQLSAGIHHEVRNPLHAIQLAADNILDKLRRGKYECHLSTSELIDRVHKSTQNMLKEIERIQHSLGYFAKFARPIEHFELKPISLNDELSQFLTFMEQSHKLDYVHIEESFTKELYISANSEIFQEILFNLYNNAYEAMEGRGRLSLSACEDKEWVIFKMCDSGPGISKRVLSNMFEPFVTTKKNTESMGIGLSIIEQYIRELGGAIQAENSSTGGAQITVKFKKAEQPEVKLCVGF